MKNRKLINTGMNKKKLSEDVRRARRNLSLKIALEQPFIRELTTYFNNIRKTAVSKFRRAGESLTATDFDFKTQDVLSKQYRRVSRAFRNEMRLFLTESKSFEFKQTEEEDDRIDEAVDTALAIMIVNEVFKSSRQIDRTTRENIASSFSEANLEIIANGGSPTLDAVATIAGVKMKKKFSGRIGNIAQTETQKSAEATKLIEVQVVSRVQDKQGKKQWTSVFLVTTREAHALAHGQIRDIDSPFLVDGELLMMPGDTSLGASAGNVIRCHCSGDAILT